MKCIDRAKSAVDEQSVAEVETGLGRISASATFCLYFEDSARPN